MQSVWPKHIAWGRWGIVGEDAALGQFLVEIAELHTKSALVCRSPVKNYALLLRK